MSVRVRVGARSLVIGDHAVERYQERVRPALDQDAVLIELARILQAAELTQTAPAWTTASSDRADEWVILTDSIAFPVVDGRLTTCLTRGEVGAEIRIAERKDHRDFRNARKSRGGRKQHGKVAREGRARRRQALGEFDG